jgi:hypothetical protein
VKSALQERAEIELLSLIERERSRRAAPRRPPWRSTRTSYQDSEEAERRERECFRFSVEALAAIGAIPKSEIGNWIDRFESEGRARERWPEVAADPETKRRARALLEDRLPANDLEWEGDTYKRAVWRFQEAQATINISGALPRDERMHWQERFLERVSPEDRGKLQNPPLCMGVDLERVVVGPPVRNDGLRITHVELHADGVVVHWHYAVVFPPGRERTSWERFQTSSPERASMLELADDAGTSYRWSPGPSHDAAFRKDGFVHWLSATFTPAAPAEATRLVASREGETFEIPLTS